MYYRADVAIDDVVVRVEDQQNCTTFPYNAAPGIYIYIYIYILHILRYLFFLLIFEQWNLYIFIRIMQNIKK